MEIGPEGAVYVLDWHDADICGKDVLNKDTGRVFRVTPTRFSAKDWSGRYDDVSKMSNQQLVALQLSPSAWHARRARVVLQHRATTGAIDGQTHDALRGVLKTHSNPDYRLRALWGLHVTGGIDEAELIAMLGDRDEYLRAWAVQLLCEDKSPSSAALEKFMAMAEEDSSPVVRLYLASALQRMPHRPRWPIAAALVAYAEDARDHNIPKMIWFGIEPLVPEATDRALELAEQCRIPAISRYIARRAADADRLENLVAAAGKAQNMVRELLQGMQDSLEGRFDVTPPANWDSVYAKLNARGDDVSRIAVALAQQFGDTDAAAEMLAMLSDENAAVETRRQALRGLVGQKHPQLRPRLLELLNHDALRPDVIRAMASFDDQRMARHLLNRYADFSVEDKLEAVHTLASRSRYGWELTQAIRRGDVPKRDVPAYVARQLRRVVGNGFVEVWGPIDAISADKEAAFARYGQLLASEAMDRADPRRGRAVFKRTCHACHKLYGEGGAVGPDITGANRTNLEYLLGNILTPSAVIQDAYRMLLVLTDEGRTYSGILVDENQRQLRLRVAGQEEPVVIAKSTIESREIAPVSMMPEGLLGTLKDSEVLDLVAYLRTAQQVPLPEESE